ncbi:glycosyltransferase [Clostridium neuense]|uniref:Glycosyltransferase n=1 Tax=Clostridium neuense TaxID=1728934 RepID=A0ABW8TGK1_9CLOT
MFTEKIIIFGASRLGEIAYNVLKDKYKICCFSDNNSNKVGTKFCNIEVINPNELSNYSNFKIIIASMYYGEISMQLKKYGVNDIYIFFYIDPSDTTYKKTYCIEKMCDLNNYKSIIIDKEFKKKYQNNFSLIYGENSSSIKDNMSKEKKVLIFAYIFPPIGGSGVQRTLKFVKYLNKYGWKPIVVTCGKNFFQDGEDKTLLDEIPKDTQIIRIDDEYFNSERLSKKQIQQIINLLYGLVDDNGLMSKFVNYIKNVNRKEVLTPDACISWVNSVMQRIESIIDFNDIDIIYTTSAPCSVHIAGYYLKKKYSNIPWVADFRDEWTYNPYLDMNESDMKFKLERELEKNIVNTADKIVAVTPMAVENYIKNFNICKSKITNITNGFDEEDFYFMINKIERNYKFTVISNGTFYLKRAPYSFIRAVNELIQECKIKKEELHIEFVGKMQNEIQVKIEELDIYNLIKIKSYIPHIESLINASKADLLLLVVGNDEKVKRVYPGKIFEYLRLKKDILALSPRGSVVEGLLNETKCGKNFEYDDVQGVKEYILDCYNLWKQNKKYNEFDDRKIKIYDRVILTGELVKVFEELLRK